MSKNDVWGSGVLPDSLSLERLVPAAIPAGDEFAHASLTLHLARYEFAVAHCAPGTILDIACGVGYGTSLLAGEPAAIAVIGVDCAEAAVSYAKQRYAAPNIRYFCADALSYLRTSTEFFSNIVSLETIEHLEAPADFLELCRARLGPKGRIICSVPISPTTDINPYHLHDFTRVSFLSLLSRCGLRVVGEFEQQQKPQVATLLRKESCRTQKPRGGLLRHYLRDPQSCLRRIRALCCDGLVTRYLTVIAESE